MVLYHLLYHVVPRSLTHESSRDGGEEHFLASNRDPSFVVLHVSDKLLELESKIARIN